MKVLALSSSPRKDGNSRMLAEAVLDGARSRGHQTELADLADHVTAQLRDCRTCELADGTCSIPDGHGDLLHDKVLRADAIVLATPVYWYGISGQLKAFIDRIFCHTRSGHPRAAETKRLLMHKRLALVVSSEEAYPGILVGITAQMQELARYLGHGFAGVVHGVGNARGEVVRDPARPLDRAFEAGAGLFDRAVTDYRMDTVRDGHVWPAEPRE